MLPDCDDLIEHFDTWPWTDFRLCNWTDAYPAYDSRGRGRVPKGLNEFFLGLNEKSLSCVKHAFGRSNDTNVPRPVNRTGVITFSHFLPNQRSLPDWKELNASTFRRREWLDHGAPGLSAKFAIVAGSSSVDAQIRSLLNARQRSHVHVFGHSHRPKDFEYEGIRYVHNPLGNPRERHGGMIDTKVAFKIIWDTRTLNGIIPAEQIIRYWDEKGGGKKALLRYCKGQSEAHHD